MPNPTVPDFTELGARKLADLLEKGFVITGVCFERQVGGTQPQRGFVDFAGFVGWWHPVAAPLTEAATMAIVRDCYDCRDAIRRAEAKHGITAHGVADMKGGQDVDA